MSQVLLGFRNLALRIAVFVVLAAGLAWFLGGNLFPRNSLVVVATASTGPGDGQLEVRLERVVRQKAASLETYLQIATLESSGPLGAGGTWTRCETQDRLREATHPASVGAGTTERAVWFVGEPVDAGGAWRVYRIQPYGNCPERMLEVADRLEAVRQLARVTAGLPLQTPEAGASARDAVLRAGDAP